MAITTILQAKTNFKDLILMDNSLSKGSTNISKLFITKVDSLSTPYVNNIEDLQDKVEINVLSFRENETNLILNAVKNLEASYEYNRLYFTNDEDFIIYILDIPTRNELNIDLTFRITYEDLL